MEYESPIVGSDVERGGVEPEQFWLAIASAFAAAIGYYVGTQVGQSLATTTGWNLD